MSALTITVPPGQLQAFTQEVELDGKVYELSFRYNRRESKWYVTLIRNGAALVSNIKVVHGADLFSQFKYIEDMPQGNVLVEDINGRDRDPDADSFGSTVFMRYQNAV